MSGYDFVRCVLLDPVRGAGAGIACHVALWQAVRLLGVLPGNGRLPPSKQDTNSP
ncbi:hypothetical protein EV190_103251 [Actinorugispora endophytica]|uniref:Uncharacterized protein n=1 Tax=Actinorugispora endophytica TaxID=1605990 RepID=A0A4V3D8Z1_9ACTN|nr:hypothetical protein EV190_103251 [Actinorugispora endophytica]